MCKDCERYEADAKKANTEDWITLQEKLSKPLSAVFVNILGTVVQVYPYDLLNAVINADKSKPCPGWLDDYPKPGNIIITGIDGRD